MAQTTPQSPHHRRRHRRSGDRDLPQTAGIDAQVFEAWPYSTGIGGGLQIAPNGMHVLAEIGLADEMIRRGSIAESFDFYSQIGRRARLDQPRTWRSASASPPSICAAPR